MEHHFTDHLLDAIALNRARQPIYEALSGGGSAPVSRRLVLLERGVLPLARWFDRRCGGRLARAFVPMAELAEPSTPPRWTSGGSLRAWWDASVTLAALQVRSASPLARGEMDGVLSACVDALSRLDALEERHEVHLAMCRHVVESSARGAALAATGCVGVGSRRFVGVQLAGLLLAPGVDRCAWRCHAVGVGIVVNDLPVCFDAGTARQLSQASVRGR